MSDLQRLIVCVVAFVAVTIFYYLGAVYVAGSWNPAEWEPINKLFSLIIFWLLPLVLTIGLIWMMPKEGSP